MASKNSEATTDQKEEHRLGTINRWDPPEADWAAEHDWTRYRGPQPYPVPADWVLDEPEGGAVGWYHFPNIGEGHGTSTDVYDTFDPDYDAIEEARGERAFLINDIVEDSRNGPVILEHEFSIAGETVFSRIDPNDEELWATVADALTRYAGGDSVEEIAADIGWQSGRLSTEERERRRQERRREENQSLEAFSDE